MLIKAFTVSQSVPLVSRLWVRKDREGTQIGQLILTDQKDIPYHMASYSVIKAAMREFFQHSHCSGLEWIPVCLWEVVSGCISIAWDF